MNRTPNGWTIVDAERPVLSYEYSFGPGLATTFVAGIGGGKLMAVSPASKIPDAAMDDLKAYGEVVALVAPNGFHHMGLDGWLKRWPTAKAYAAESSLARLKGKCSVGGMIQPLSQLASLPPEVKLDEPPGLKAADLVVRVKTAQGWIWYFNDLVMNLRELPKQVIVRLIFRLTGARTGLAAPGLAKMLFVKNAKTLGAWLARELDATPPAGVVFGHGEPLVRAGLGASLKSVIAERY